MTDNYNEYLLNLHQPLSRPITIKCTKEEAIKLQQEVGRTALITRLEIKGEEASFSFYPSQREIEQQVIITSDDGRPVKAIFRLKGLVG